MFTCSTFFQATEPSQLWITDLDALGVVLDEIAEIDRKQDVEDAKQRKNAGKGKVRLLRIQLVALRTKVVVRTTPWVISSPIIPHCSA